MQQLKFSCVDNLPGLLDKTKTSTLRKAYYSTDLKGDVTNADAGYKKPPKFKVGEIVEAIWTGKEVVFINAETGDMSPQVLGKVKIKVIEKVEVGFEKDIDKEEDIKLEYFYVQNEEEMIDVVELTKKEGFDNPDKMFKYLESYAPEIKERAMPFIRYEFEWVKS